MTERIKTTMNKRMTVQRIVFDGDSLLLYRRAPDRFRVIAPLEIDVSVGDTIEYEPYRTSGGWFVEVVQRASAEKADS